MLQVILDFLRRLFGAAPDNEPDEAPCTVPHDLEIPSEIPHDGIPRLISAVQIAAFDAQAVTTGEEVAPPLAADAQVAGCRLTIRPELGTVNIRLGPGVDYEPPLAKTEGGVTFELVGATEADADGLRWYAVRLGGRSGWVRGDLVIISQECLSYTFISADDLRPPAPIVPPPDGRFPLPTAARITQGYRVPAHPGFDMISRTGTPLIAPADGFCIRRIDCTRCTEQRPNRQPNHLFQCPDTWKDPGWGYGYGNFIIMRHDYNRLPAPLRTEMNRHGLRNAYAYILYAHLSRVNVVRGQYVRAGTVLGATGNTGCSSAPHLHFEVRIGNDTEVDDVWAMQRPVHPRFIFDTP
jgi:murein DD-endopeptidase MepM/ murein hydrolase activator NlpD